jgi:hypothetical protein
MSRFAQTGALTFGRDFPWRGRSNRNGRKLNNFGNLPTRHFSGLANQDCGSTLLIARLIASDDHHEPYSSCHFAFLIVRAHVAWREVGRWYVLADECGPGPVAIDVAGGGFANEFA